MSKTPATFKPGSTDIRIAEKAKPRAGIVKFFNAGRGFGFVNRNDETQGFLRLPSMPVVEAGGSINVFGSSHADFVAFDPEGFDVQNEDFVGYGLPAAFEERQPVAAPDEDARRALLERAAKGPPVAQDPLDRLEDAIRTETVMLLGGPKIVGRAIENDSDLLAALIQGFPSGVLVALREAGFPHSVLEQVIAPRRTLMRRKAEAQRLTRGESDAAWRLARLLALASHVLDGKAAAIDWLIRAKPVFDNRSPIDLAETSVGCGHVERLLRNLEWGDVA